MPKKILLADDSITIQKVVELTFSDGDYEVIATNNGAKALQKLSEVRPDIILSDIIMPEKNGYEVCEFVKSHPDYRTIPVILLTGTFEPFDPDRAEKAGCDAVVTKPFESQSLIQKVEELIAQNQPAAAAAPEQPAAAETPSSIFETAAVPPVSAPEPEPSWSAPNLELAPPPAPEPSPFAPAADESPFAPGGSFAPPPMSLEEPPATAAASDSSPFEELPKTEAPPDHGSEIFAAPPQPSAAADMPFEAPPRVEYSAETRAFPAVSFEDLQRMAKETAPPAAPPPPEEPEVPQMELEPPPPPVAAESPFEEPAAYSGETRAFPRVSFEELQRMAAETAPPPAEPETPPPAAAAAPETTAFPSMSFDEVPRPQMEVETSWAPATPAPAETPWEAPAPSADESPFEPAAEPAAPFAPPPPMEAAPEWQAPPPPLDMPPPSSAEMSGPMQLTDEQIDRIARRVIELMSDQVVKNIAWEVIPDLAEVVVRERIRQLESEA
jgi:CheY-like chemotaxis protein